ncbi:MAG TPA: cyclase family protein [Pyrinomonadaceae bacterium]|jgi:kynurenine formamidase|nr:cyclase family protein [Pyrinomonadaceae bacterium]
MKTTVRIASEAFEIDLDSPIDISIPLNFNGPQPNAFGVEPAISKACEYGSLIGDTRRGGSVNFEQYTLIPHCNGTHTECVGHITNERIAVRDCLKDVLIPATLVSVGSEAFEDDLVITESRIRKALVEPRAAVAQAGRALILRTLPNDDAKLSRTYNVGNLPYYFTQVAMEFIVDLGFKHLLVDLPSIDRLYDEGELANHRIFWNVEPGSFEVNANTRMNSTITELIYVPNEVEDGEYLLNLQIAPFASDAAPSRPILFRPAV